MRRATAIAAACLALAVGACGDEDRPAAEPASPPSAVPVRFPGADGEPVEGTFRPAGDRAPAVILVNGLIGGPGQWDAFAPALHDAGFASLAYEGRGGVDVTALAREVAGAVAFLRTRDDVDPRRLAIVGSSVGASTAVLAMTGPDGRRLRAAVALSPRAESVFDAVARRAYHPRNVLFVSDQREAPTVERLVRGAAGSRLVVTEAVGHGVAQLESAAQREVVLDWLAEHLR